MPNLKREADLFPQDLFDGISDSRDWWVCYLRSRQEKSLARYLVQRQVPFYLPQQEKRVRRSGRTRVSYLPLFPSYVFLRATSDERRKAVQSNLLVSLLEVPDQAGLTEELTSLWHLQQAGGALVPHPYLEIGDAVRIAEGPFRDYRGHVIRAAGKFRVVVSITLLRQSVSVEFEREVLEPIRRPAA